MIALGCKKLIKLCLSQNAFFVLNTTMKVPNKSLQIANHQFKQITYLYWHKFLWSIIWQYLEYL